MSNFKESLSYLAENTFLWKYKLFIWSGKEDYLEDNQDMESSILSEISCLVNRRINIIGTEEKKMKPVILSKDVELKIS